jgi:hypothetical protein
MCSFSPTHVFLALHLSKFVIVSLPPSVVRSPLPRTSIMSTYDFPAIVKYEGIAESDIEDEEYPSATYIAIKKQPFYTTIAAHGRPGFFSNCTTKISLNYYDTSSHSVTPDLVTFVNTFPVGFFFSSKILSF